MFRERLVGAMMGLHVLFFYQGIIDAGALS